MERAGYKCIGYVEFDKFARRSYQAMHDTKGEWTKYDITTVSNDDIRRLGNKRRIDVITAGFPCQAFSIAGQRRGFDDTRGTLFFEIARFANIIRPQYLFLENVRGLLSHDNGNTFETILRTLDELGYDAEWDLLNSKDFGIPQNRERVFIIGHLRGSSARKVFPITRNDRENNKSIEIYGFTRKSKVNDRNRIIRTTGLCQSLRATDYKDPPKIKQAGMQEPIISGIYTNASKDFQRPPLQGLSRTLKANQHDAGITGGERARKLTPKECWRLQGFPDQLFEKAQAVNSDSQLYKQAGNAVTVNVIYEIAKKLGGDHS